MSFFETALQDIENYIRTCISSLSESDLGFLNSNIHHGISWAQISKLEIQDPQNACWEVYFQVDAGAPVHIATQKIQALLSFDQFHGPASQATNSLRWIGIHFIYNLNMNAMSSNGPMISRPFSVDNPWISTMETHDTVVLSKSFISSCSKNLTNYHVFLRIYINWCRVTSGGLGGSVNF